MSNWLDKVNVFFRFTSYLFKFYLKRRLFPKTEKKISDHAEDGLIYLGTWLIVVLAYVLFIYFFIHQSDASVTSRLYHLVDRAPLDILRDVYETSKVSIYFNMTFLVVLFVALLARAERDILRDIFTHSKIAGLIKTVKVGTFNESSLLTEVNKKQLTMARKNIKEILSNKNVERIDIITASGYDFFGNPEPLEPGATKKTDLENGYLLNLLEQQEKHFRILLMDPATQEYVNRAEGYFSNNSHRPLKEPSDYKKSVEICTSNIKKASKSNRNIELRLSEQNPDWKMIFSEREVWVQPILRGFRSDHSPIYGFLKSPHSMYHAFWNFSEELWHSARQVDLSDNDEAETAAKP